ncbi:DJ-1/PfpI family protein [Undibacterium sp. TJN19]|uniref:DJ-1/PfpI family protein n=1 Tax=Undibacterium sp. TJN19 TaxID=3413055 RepID=UPI003BF28EE2
MSAVYKIGFLLYPHLTQLDLTGPAQVFARMSNVQLHFVWKNTDPVASDADLQLMPTHSFSTCPQLDLLCVPGGPGTQRLMQDQTVLAWLHAQGQQAGFITSVCSGSLLLGAAGLLKGYRAASHWNYRQYLPMFGAIIDEARVVKDRNRISGGGVTAGIDFALTVVAEIRGDEEAKEIQLMLEYAPQPPFHCGRPELAGEALVARVKQKLANAVAETSKDVA